MWTTGTENPSPTMENGCGIILSSNGATRFLIYRKKESTVKVNGAEVDIKKCDDNFKQAQDALGN